MTLRIRTLPAVLAVAAGLLMASAVHASPKVVKKVPPDFPREALQKGVSSGVVNAEVAIESDGKVSKVTIVSAEPKRIFDRAVNEALMEWRFEPSGEKQVHAIRLVFRNDD